MRRPSPEAVEDQTREEFARASDQSDDEPFDRQNLISALKLSGQLKRKSRSDDEVEVDSEGRLIIREGGDGRKGKSDEPHFDTMSESDSHLSGTQVKRSRKTLDTGREYAGEKESGDVKRMDKLEPAYWPLDRKMMSYRPQHRAAARRGIASVVNTKKKK